MEMILGPAGWRARSMILLTLFWWALIGGMVWLFWGFGLGAFVVVSINCLIMVPIGLVIAWFAIRGAFGVVLISVDDQTISVRRRLFGWETSRRIDIGPTTRARLEESYRSNNRVIYRLAIVGANRRAYCHVKLPEHAQEWVAQTINDRLGTPDQAVARVFAGDEEADANAILWRRDNVAPLAPENLPSATPIRLHEETSERLEFSIPACDIAQWRWIATLVLTICVLLCAGVMASLWSLAGGADLDAMFFVLLPGGWVLALLFGLIAFAHFGRITLSVTGERITIRGHLGPYGKQQSVETAMVRKVIVAEDHSSLPMLRHLAMLLTVAPKARIVALAGVHDRETDRAVAGLVRYQLERLGYSL